MSNEARAALRSVLIFRQKYVDDFPNDQCIREYLANDYLVYNHFKAKFDQKVNSFGLPR